MDARRQRLVQRRGWDRAVAHYEPFWARHDALVVPTVGRLLKLADVLEDPVTPNFQNGYYTNCANPLGLAAVAAPYGANADGVPYGVTFLAPAGSEPFLCRLAEAFAAGAAA